MRGDGERREECEEGELLMEDRREKSNNFGRVERGEEGLGCVGGESEGGIHRGRRSERADLGGL